MPENWEREPAGLHYRLRKLEDRVNGHEGLEGLVASLNREISQLTTQFALQQQALKSYQNEVKGTKRLLVGFTLALVGALLSFAGQAVFR